MQLPKYKRLSLEQRYQISCLLREGYSYEAIGQRIGKSRSTISREVRRNTPKRGKEAHVYDAASAQRKTDFRQRHKNRYFKLTESMLIYLRHKIMEERWSPELISVKGKEELGDFVSHEIIYQYIWTAKYSNHQYYQKDKDLHKYLRHSGRRQKRKNRKENRGCITERVSITERPEEANNRERLGDYEVDLMMGANHKPGLIVIRDRYNRQGELIKTTTKNAKVIAKKIIARLKTKPRVNTITFDNDLAFAEHKEIAKALGAKTYFTRPYTSQDKGSVENLIGQLRRWFPKGTSLVDVHPNTIRAIERKINNRPLRIFNYLSANEMNYLILNNVALVT